MPLSGMVTLVPVGLIPGSGSIGANFSG
jgi:hypothetical protein